MRCDCDWCPNIPNDWKQVRLKDIAILKSGDSFTADELSDDEENYPVYGGNGLRGYTEKYNKDGDYILIGRQGALCGNINYAHGKFFATEHALVVNTYKKLNTTWLGETLRCADYNRLSQSAAQPGLAASVLMNQFIPFPPEVVRERIVSYLDDKTAKIDKAVSLLQKKRDAYTRLKASIINRAVTRGLNPNVKLKDSGVEWIGMIPENWNVKRIKEIGKLQLGKMLTEKPIEGYKLYPYLKSKNIGYLELNLNSVEEMYFSDSEFKALQLHKNDLIFSEGGEVGKTAIWQDKVSNCCIQNSVQKLTVNENCDARYYLYLSYILGKMGYYKSIVNLVSIMHLTYEKLRRVQVLVPPKEEQQAIANYLDTHCVRIDRAISIVDKQIDAYTRLKKSLINEVVTGKRAV